VVANAGSRSALQNGLVEFDFAVAVFGGGEKLVEGSAVKIFSAEPDCLDLRGVVNAREGIGGKQDKVGPLSRRYGAKLGGAAEKFRGAQRGCLERGERSEPGFDEQGKFVVQAEARHAVRIHDVRAGEQGNAGAEHHPHHLLIGFEQAAVKLKFGGRPAAKAEIVRGIPATAQLGAHVSDARVGSELAVIHVAEGAKDGERGNLPGPVAAELGEKRLERESILVLRCKKTTLCFMGAKGF